MSRRTDREAVARTANAVLGVAHAAAWGVFLVACVTTGQVFWLGLCAVAGAMAMWLLWGEAEPPPPGEDRAEETHTDW